ncbi:hypothetical protein NM208_g14841 [Fusarium decemcellulare]|uniref:Uncharacterized protein n=1 Tax=Fusarium decemcellulare TaxID=57161 RepID=A0ACC1RHE3_9HYPO|nr:hypothetical protein NM208_g14841 [Fusarium decemcellulare]
MAHEMWCMNGGAMRWARKKLRSPSEPGVKGSEGAEGRTLALSFLRQRPFSFLKGTLAKIPRPPNAYILYRKERHHLVKKLNPGITNNQISQVLGQCWNMETREVRAQYKSMAEAIKKDHREKHPGYQYKPRRPSREASPQHQR